MPVEVLSAKKASEWDAYVADHPDANCYHLRAWQEIAQRVYGLYAPLLVARDRTDGPLSGALPLVTVRHPVRGGYATNGLFGSYGRILASSPTATRELLDAAQAIAAQQRADFLIVKSIEGEPPPQGAIRKDLSRVSKLPLHADPDLMWKGFRDSVRRAVRKALRSELRVVSGPDQTAVFYDILAENLHTKGTPPYGLAVMTELARRLGEAMEVLTVWQGSQAVAGAVLIYFRDTVNLAFAASKPSALSLRPNNLLYWEIIQRSCKRGMKFLEFGRSAIGSGQLTFKLGWGASSVAQPLYLYPVRGAVPSLDPKNSGVQLFINIWKRLPRGAADAIGPYIWKYYLAGIG